MALLVGLLPACHQGRQRSTAQKTIPVATPASATAPLRLASSVNWHGRYVETTMMRDTREPADSSGSEPPSIREYPGAARIELPRPHPKSRVSLERALYRESASGAAPLPDLLALSDLLYYGYGETGGSGGLRAAASAGALYPTDIFLSVRRASGLARGIYYYDPRRHDLVRVAAPQPSTAVDVPLSLIMGASYRRTAFKYGTRAPRYVALDVGHVAANLLLTSRALGIDCGANERFAAQELQRALGLTAESEGVLMVLDCAAADARSSPPATRGTANSARDLFDVIRERRSHRRFLEAPVEQTGLEELTAAMSLLGKTDVVQTWLFVRSVSGLAPGLYRHDTASGRLELARSGDFSSEVAHAGLDQSMLAEAAYVVAWTLVDEQVFGRACLQVGIMGEVGYLMATNQNLGACGVGAFYDAEIGELFGDNPQRALYLLAVGKPR